MLSPLRDSGEGVKVESNHRYFLRRAEEENRRVRNAITQAAQDRHRELAELFAAKAAKTMRIQNLQVARG